MSDYGAAFLNGFNSIVALRQGQSEREFQAQAYEKLTQSNAQLNEIARTTTVPRQRKDPMAEAAALPVGQDTPVAALPAVTGALPAPAPVAPAAALPVAPAPAPAPAAALPAAPAPATALPAPASAAPEASAAASPVDPSAPIVSADSDALNILKPMAVNYAEIGGMLAHGGFTPEQSANLIEQYNATGNALATQFLGLAAVNFGSAEGGNALAALMESNDPDGNYRATYRDGRYVVVDLTSDNPNAESHVFSREQVEQLLAQATAGKSPILAYNKAFIEMGINSMKAQADLNDSATRGVQAGTAAKALEGTIADRAEGRRLQGAELERRLAADEARMTHLAGLLGLKADALRAKATTEKLDPEALVAGMMAYSTNPVFKTMEQTKFLGLLRTMIDGGVSPEVALDSLAQEQKAYIEEQQKKKQAK